jgi:hypothetical protein
MICKGGIAVPLVPVRTCLQRENFLAPAPEKV